MPVNEHAPEGDGSAKFQVQASGHARMDVEVQHLYRNVSETAANGVLFLSITDPNNTGRVGGDLHFDAASWVAIRNRVEWMFREAGVPIPASNRSTQEFARAARERQEAERIREDTRAMIETARIHTKALRDAG